MEIIEFRISRYGNTPIFGVCLSEGQNWLVIRENEVDYYLGGIKFINKKYIRHRIIVDNDAMKLDCNARILSPHIRLMFEGIPLLYWLGIEIKSAPLMFVGIV